MIISARASNRRVQIQRAAQSTAPIRVLRPASDAKAAKPASRVAIVAHAVAHDRTCKGKADLALAMLADDELAGVSGGGIVKLLGKVDAAQFRMGGTDGRADPHDWRAIHDDIRARRDTQIEGI